MAEKTQRRTVLERLLGDKKKEEVDEKFQQLALELDAAGINRKEYVVNRFKGLLEDLQPQIMAVLDGLTDDETLKTEAANQALAVVMGAFANAPEEPVEEEPLDEVATEIMQEEPVAEDEDEEEEVVMAEMRQAVIDLAKETQDVHQAWAQDVIPAIVEIAKVQKQLAPLLKELDGFKGLDKRIKQLEAVANLRPRVASQAEDTVMKDDEKSAKLKAAIQKGVEGEQLILGNIRVKPGTYPQS